MEFIEKNEDNPLKDQTPLGMAWHSKMEYAQIILQMM
jgi:hypothetical protein